MELCSRCHLVHETHFLVWYLQSNDTEYFNRLLGTSFHFAKGPSSAVAPFSINADGHYNDMKIVK